MPFTCAREIYESPYFAQFCVLFETYKLHFADAIQNQSQPRGDARYDPEKPTASPFHFDDIDSLTVASPPSGNQLLLSPFRTDLNEQPSHLSPNRIVFPSGRGASFHEFDPLALVYSLLFARPADFFQDTTIDSVQGKRIYSKTIENAQFFVPWLNLPRKYQYRIMNNIILRTHHSEVVQIARNRLPTTNDIDYPIARLITDLLALVHEFSRDVALECYNTYFIRWLNEIPHDIDVQPILLDVLFDKQDLSILRLLQQQHPNLTMKSFHAAIHQLDDDDADDEDDNDENHVKKRSDDGGENADDIFFIYDTDISDSSALTDKQKHSLHFTNFPWVPPASFGSDDPSTQNSDQQPDNNDDDENDPRDRQQQLKSDVAPEVSGAVVQEHRPLESLFPDLPPIQPESVPEECFLRQVFLEPYRNNPLLFTYRENCYFHIPQDLVTETMYNNAKRYEAALRDREPDNWTQNDEQREALLDRWEVIFVEIPLLALPNDQLLHLLVQLLQYVISTSTSVENSLKQEREGAEKHTREQYFLLQRWNEIISIYRNICIPYTKLANQREENDDADSSHIDLKALPTLFQADDDDDDDDAAATAVTTKTDSKTKSKATSQTKSATQRVSHRELNAKERLVQTDMDFEVLESKILDLEGQMRSILEELRSLSHQYEPGPMDEAVTGYYDIVRRRLQNVYVDRAAQMKYLVFTHQNAQYIHIYKTPLCTGDILPRQYDLRIEFDSAPVQENIPLTQLCFNKQQYPSSSSTTSTTAGKKSSPKSTNTTPIPENPSETPSQCPDVLDELVAPFADPLPHPCVFPVAQPIAAPVVQNLLSRDQSPADILAQMAVLHAGAAQTTYSLPPGAPNNTQIPSIPVLTSDQRKSALLSSDSGEDEDDDDDDDADNMPSKSKPNTTTNRPATTAAAAAAASAFNPPQIESPFYFAPCVLNRDDLTFFNRELKSRVRIATEATSLPQSFYNQTIIRPNKSAAALKAEEFYLNHPPKPKKLTTTDADMTDSTDSNNALESIIEVLAYDQHFDASDGTLANFPVEMYQAVDWFHHEFDKLRRLATRFQERLKKARDEDADSTETLDENGEPKPSKESLVLAQDPHINYDESFEPVRLLVILEAYVEQRKRDLYLDSALGSTIEGNVENLLKVCQDIKANMHRQERSKLLEERRELDRLQRQLNAEENSRQPSSRRTRQTAPRARRQSSDDDSDNFQSDDDDDDSTSDDNSDTDDESDEDSEQEVVHTTRSSRNNASSSHKPAAVPPPRVSSRKKPSFQVDEDDDDDDDIPTTVAISSKRLKELLSSSDEEVFPPSRRPAPKKQIISDSDSD